MFKILNFLCAMTFSEDTYFLEIPIYVLFKSEKNVKIALQFAYSGIAALNYLISRVALHHFWMILIITETFTVGFATCQKNYE